MSRDGRPADADYLSGGSSGLALALVCRRGIQLRGRPFQDPRDEVREGHGGLGLYCALREALRGGSGQYDCELELDPAGVAQHMLGAIDAQYLKESEEHQETDQ